VIEQHGAQGCGRRQVAQTGERAVVPASPGVTAQQVGREAGNEIGLAGKPHAVRIAARDGAHNRAGQPFPPALGQVGVGGTVGHGQRQRAVHVAQHIDRRIAIQSRFERGTIGGGQALMRYALQPLSQAIRHTCFAA
jgi:hypothetical protein